MKAIKLITVILLAIGLAGCGSKFKKYNGPEVTQVIVQKDERRLFLMHHNKVLKTYPVELGFAPQGHKQFEGDGKTPEGFYYIDRRNPNSKFHLSIGLSYPNPSDRAFAAANKSIHSQCLFWRSRSGGNFRLILVKMIALLSFIN